MSRHEPIASVDDPALRVVAIGQQSGPSSNSVTKLFNTHVPINEMVVFILTRLTQQMVARQRLGWTQNRCLLR
ncbi:hypothetical protein [Ruegeria atlantica]|uniref:hypothetical protein n=1 Tax=Ruegeria atlantica TaxID=81569 RepID=UPI00147E4E46|nr:hypothetical protein [Ruegeria atlantica]